jgi:endonuclease YncB( thermonuclease family)
LEGKMRLRVGVLAAVVCAGVAVVCGAENWTGICRGVVDGDTIEVLKAGEIVLVEMVAIDAPELGQPWGDEAKTFLEDVVMNREVSVIDRKRLQGGVVEARVHVGEVDVDQEILAAGLAWTGDTTDSNLIISRMNAEGRKLGLWSQEKPEAPWLFRKRQDVRPTPIPVRRSLADLAKGVELEKNAGGKTVIAGLPPMSKDSKDQGSASGKPGIDDEGKYHLDFTCPEDGLQGCAEAEFRASYQRFYKSGPGVYSANTMDYGGGKWLFLFKLGLTRGVGVSCDCSDGKQCACSINLAPVKK